jgi:hypothetical protein
VGSGFSFAYLRVLGGLKVFKSVQPPRTRRYAKENH